MQSKSNTYFKEVASLWDDLRKGYFPDSLRDEVIKKAYLLPEMIVADIGAGSGFLSSLLVTKTEKVHLVDSSEAMLAQAKQNLTSYDNVEFHLAAGNDIPLPDDSLDAVFANMYLHHTSDPLAAIQEMARLLKPGGRLIISDLDLHTNTWMQEEMADEWPGFDREQVMAWFHIAKLVNNYVVCSGSNCCGASQNDPSLTADISTFIAIGSKHISRKADVKQSYGVIAESGGSCGCNPPQSSGGYQIVEQSCCPPKSSENSLYKLEELRVIPEEAGEISLGCGNPLAMASLKPGETVLDIGSGGGIDVFLAANRVGKTGRVIGVDMTPAMLKRARESALKNGYDQVEFRQGDAENLPVDDQSVDVVISNCVINLTEDKGKAFQEIFRVLKPGGRLEISDVVAAHNLPLAVRENPNQWAACVSGALPQGEYLELITYAGFENLTTQNNHQYSNNSEATYSLVVSARKPETN
ncbi:MAG: arsenite methyltransferase [Anaerolineaceae bacterium]|nr:arsenite methyltransferase [Anaerolineaceae bacterium]